MVFEQVVQLMADMGVFQLFFPWLLVLAVSYGILDKSHVFSEDPGVNGVIALAVAFISIGGAYFFLPAGIMTSFAAGLTFSLFGLLGVMILMAAVGVDISGLAGGDDGDKTLYWIAFTLGLLSFIGAFVFTADVGALLAGVEDTFQEVVMPILILVFLLIIVSITVSGE